MKRIIFVLIIIFLSFPLIAQDAYQKQRIIDDAGLLTAAEISGLERRAEEIAKTYSIDLVIVTKTDLGGEGIIDYADDYFDYGGYGLDNDGNNMGEDRDGVLFLQVTAERDYRFSTSGRAINLLDKNDYAFDKLEKDMLKFLRVDDYAGAYYSFFEAMEEFLVLEAKGRRYNFFHRWNFVLVAVGWVVSFLIGLYSVNYWKSGMKIYLPIKQADSYFLAGSLAFSQQKERFLYSNVSKTIRVDSSTLGGGSGGTRTSSSGRSHGGRSGKY